MSRDRKKVLFSCYGLGIGGIEKCLVNLLNIMPQEEFDIDVLLMNPEYSSIEQIHKPINFLESYVYVMNTTDTFHEIQKKGGILRNFGKFFDYCRFRVRVKLEREPWKVFRPLPEEYDIAVAYSQNDFSAYYVIDKVKANRKILWYHNGAYERTGKEFTRDFIYYHKFDYIVAVSADCRKVLQERFNFDSNKLIVLRNICDVPGILKMANQKLPASFGTDKNHIVTVGRLTSEKGADLAIEACRLLLQQGYNICWHWVGDGNRKIDIQEKIEKYSLHGKFVLEGNQQNPYPYIKNACVYVQPSYYEAFSTTITEARILAKPIVTTDVGGMRDQIIDKENGLIVSISAEKIAYAVGLLLDNAEMRERFTQNLQANEMDMSDYFESYMQTVFCEV